MTHTDYGMCNTILQVIGYRDVLLIRCWSVLDRDRGYTGRP